MPLEKTAIEKIAWLARLNLNNEDIPEYIEQLSNIFNLVEQMNSVDAAAIVPLSHPLELSARLRQDVVMEADQRGAFQSIAPQTEAGLYLVPKVIE
jgi:aspartyl-tRNA(Asn)/glutamyl-tRNA(Gln) amidotransferase subunit C